MISGSNPTNLCGFTLFQLLEILQRLKRFWGANLMVFKIRGVLSEFLNDVLDKRPALVLLGGGGIKIGKFMTQKKPKSTLFADNTQTTKQTKPGPVASAATHPTTPANIRMYQTKVKMFPQIKQNGGTSPPLTRAPPTWVVAYFFLHLVAIFRKVSTTMS